MHAIPHPSRVQLSVSLSTEQAELAALALDVFQRLHAQHLPQLDAHIQEAARFIPIATLPDFEGIPHVFERICDTLFEHRYGPLFDRTDTNDLAPDGTLDDADHLLIQHYEAQYSEPKGDV